MNILISGGAGGIGSTIALQFIEKGFDVYSIDVNEKDLGPHFINLVGDVTSPASLYAVKKKIADVSFSHIITLAGRALDEWRPLCEIPVKTIHDSIDLNLIGHLNVIRIFLDQLTERTGGSVVIISSINAFGGFGLPYYSAAKAGLIGYMKTVKDEFLKMNLRINVVALGTVVTDATKQEPKDFDQLLQYTRHNRFVTKEEVALLVYSLCEDSQENGEVKVLDEGQRDIRHELH